MPSRIHISAHRRASISRRETGNRESLGVRPQDPSRPNPSGMECSILARSTRRPGSYGGFEEPVKERMEAEEASTSHHRRCFVGQTGLTSSMRQSGPSAKRGDSDFMKAGASPPRIRSEE